MFVVPLSLLLCDCRSSDTQAVVGESERAALFLADIRAGLNPRGADLLLMIDVLGGFSCAGNPGVCVCELACVSVVLLVRARPHGVCVCPR